MLAAVPVATADDAAVKTSVLPLSFIENVGQKDPAVLFHADAAGHALYFTAGEVILARVDTESGIASLISIGLTGTQPDVVVNGLDPMAGKANFFIGNNPAGWHTAVPMYGAVAYEEILPGIDLVFRGDQGSLKREFILAPAADSGSIVMKYSGQERLSLGTSGELVVTTPTGVLTETSPVCYQEINGKQVEVACRYELIGEDMVGFVLGEYNGAYPVVIDPYLDYSTYFGGTSDDMGYGVDVDDTGSAYITGYTESTNIVLPLISIYQESLAGGKDAYITKLTPDGTQLAYFTYIGGCGDDFGMDIAVNPSYEATITGYTYSADFPNLSAYQPTKSNLSDAFITRLDSTGGALVFSTFLGGNKTDQAYGIVLRSDDQPVIAGLTASTDFPVAGAYQAALAGGTDAFVSRISGGSTLVFSTYLGGAQNDAGYAVALDSSDNVFVTGTTSSFIFPTSATAFRKNLRGSADAFITKFDSMASSLTYSTYLGGFGYEGGRGIAVDMAGDAYVTGYTDSPSPPLAQSFPVSLYAFQKTYGGGKWDAFVTKMNPTGSAVNYSTYLGGRNEEKGYAIAVDNLSRAYVTGYTISPDFPTERPIQANLMGVVPDPFITQLAANGSILEFSTYFGGSYYDEGHAIVVDDSGNMTLTGYTQSLDFPVLNAYQAQLAGSPAIRNADAFITRIARILPVANFTADPTIGFVPLAVNFTDTSTGSPITWAWEFGDGNTSADQNNTHTYEAIGNYTVNLTVCNLDGCNNTSYQYIYVGPNLIPNFTANVTNGCRNLTVNFTDWTTPAFGLGSPTNWSWDFGDGNMTNVTTNASILHTYTQAGVFNVTLNVTSFFGTNETTKFDYIMVNETPIANFTTNVTVGFSPLTVQFTDNSSGYPDTWYWEFGDGNNSTLQNPVYTYVATGAYNISFNASNGCGYNWSNETFYINVGQQLLANFTADNTTGYKPFTVNFTDYSMGNATNWSWDFGDGNVTNLTTNASILHTYTDAGVFDVSLNISNIYGFDVLTRTGYISVAILPNLTFVPDPVIIPTNDTTPMQIYLEIAEFGLSGYNMSVFFDDTSAANITNVTFPPWALNQSLDSTLPAPIINIKAADITGQVNPGDTNILMLSFDTTGEAEMNTTINISVNKMSTDTGSNLVTRTIPGQVRVVTLLPLPGLVVPPTDPDGDQLYWDLNGNGDIDFADVVLYFNYMWWIELYEPIMLFDYNGNGIIDFNDLILLFNKV